MEKNITALFEINVPKAAKTLAKFASKDAIRPQFTYICIEPGRGFMTASDMQELRVINIEAVGEWPEGARILVDPKHIAKIAGKTTTVTVSEVNTAKCVEIEADGETYITEHTPLNFPDVKRVIPPKENRKAIRLTAEGVEALKTICKLSRGNYITLSAVEGDMRVIIGDEVRDYTESRTAFSIELTTPAEQTITISLNPTLLSNCLTGSNGVILVDDPYKPVMFEGEAEATILMPMRVNDRDAEFISKVRDNSLMVGSTFAEDTAEVVKQLKEAAAELWQSILNFHKHDDDTTHFTPGNYSAKDIANRGKAKCGYYMLPDNYSGNLEVKHGNITLTLDYSELFSILSFWESATRSKKSVFAVGKVEEVTAIVLESTGEGAAEKKMKLRKLGGNWYCDAKRTAKSYDTTIYYEINGVKFSVRRMAWDSIDNAEHWQKWVNNVEDQIEKLLRAQASTNDKYYTAVLERIEAQPATPAETPQISTESAETKEVSAEKEKSEIKHISEIVSTCRLHDETGEETDEWKYYQWLASVSHGNYRTIAEEALIEAGYNIFLATMRNGKGHILVMNENGELVDTIFTHAPQPPQEPPQDTGTDRRHDIPPKPKEAVRNDPAASPEPSKTILISSGPPGFKFTITPIVNKNLILQNHDRNYNLAPPHLHNRVLRLPRLPDGSCYGLRHLCSWHTCALATCQVDRQASRGSPIRPREGDSGMGTEMGKETPFTQITGYGI